MTQVLEELIAATETFLDAVTSVPETETSVPETEAICDAVYKFWLALERVKAEVSQSGRRRFYDLGVLPREEDERCHSTS